MSELSNYLDPQLLAVSDTKFCLRSKVGTVLRDEPTGDASVPSFNKKVDYHKVFKTPLPPPSLEVEPKDLKKIEEIDPLKMAVDNVIRAGLSEPSFSNALYLSGLNSALIHSPNYTISEVKMEEVERRRLVEGYDILSFLELSLRNLISDRLSVIYGDIWWKRGVPEDIREGWNGRKLRKEITAKVSYHFIYYAFIDDYRKIITKNDNWNMAFSEVFGNKSELETCFSWVGNVRDSIAHTRPVPDDSYLMFIAGARWIQLRVKKARHIVLS
jgi:hypothetical protein